MAQAEMRTPVKECRNIETDQNCKQCIGCGNRNNLRCIFSDNNDMSDYQNIAISKLIEEVFGVVDIARKNMKSVKICRACKGLLARSMRIQNSIKSHIHEINDRITSLSKNKSCNETPTKETVRYKRAAKCTPTPKKDKKKRQCTSTDYVCPSTSKECMPRRDVSAKGKLDFESTSRAMSDKNVNSSHDENDGRDHCYSAFNNESILSSKTHTDELQPKRSHTNIVDDHIYNLPHEVLEVAIESQKSEHTYCKTNEKELAFRINNRVNEKLKTYNEFNNVLDQDERSKLLLALSKKPLTKGQIADAVMECTNLFEIIKYKLIRNIDHVCERLCSKTVEPGPSVLRTWANDYDKLSEHNIIYSTVTELEKCLPFVCDVFSTVACSDGVIKPNTHSVIATMYGIAMHNRNTQLCALQKTNTAACIRHNAGNTLLSVLNKVGVTLAEGSKTSFIDFAGKFGATGLVESIRRNQSGKITMDNIDGMIIAKQLRLNSRSTSFHYAASTYFVDRVDCTDLRSITPPWPVNPKATFFLSAVEEASLKTSIGIQVSRVLVKFMPALRWMSPLIPDHIPHLYSAEMSRKSNFYSLKLVFEDPKYYTGCITIMDQILDSMRQCYEEAGRLEDFPREIFPFGGDQLVRVRASGSRGLRGGAHTPLERLEQLFPIMEELFHIQQDILEAFKTMYKDTARKPLGSMPGYRNILQRTNVNGKVKGRFQAHEDFFQTIVDALICSLFMTKANMKTLVDEPKIEGLPGNIHRIHVRNRKPHFDELVNSVVNDIFVPFSMKDDNSNAQTIIHHLDQGLVIVDAESNTVAHCVNINDVNYEDDVFNYNKQLLSWYTLYQELDDAIKEGDIFRTNICLKYLIPFFYGYSNRSKYAIECINNILLTEILLPESLSVRARSAWFVNSTGGDGRNKPADMQQENNILGLKRIIKNLGAGKTEAAMLCATSAGTAIEKIVDNYQEKLDIKEPSGRHTDKAYNEDAKIVIESALEQEVFSFKPGRKMEPYCGIKSSAFAYINKLEFEKHLEVIVHRLRRGTLEDLQGYDI